MFGFGLNGIPVFPLTLDLDRLEEKYEEKIKEMGPGSWINKEKNI